MESINEIGMPIWSDKEIEDEKRRMEELRFFRDGALMECVLTGVDKDEMVGKTSGKPYIRHTYRFEAADGRKHELVDYDFAMTSALGRFRNEGVKLRIGQQLMITPVKTGENNRGYDTFSYSVELGTLAPAVPDEGPGF
jgi:hypothetical protein